jgi:nucleoid DNA-binding protein
MNKLELIKALKEKSGLTQFEAVAVVDRFFDEICIFRQESENR